jgi:MFS family permease
MFLQYMAPGAVWPVFSARLEAMGLSSGEIADCCATQALGTLIGPLLAGQVADRWVPAERCLSICGLLAAIDLWALGGMTTAASIFAGMLIFWLLTWPILMLGATVAFTHLEVPETEYGRVRVWGTVGWAAAGWLVALWWASSTWLWAPWLQQGPGDFFRLGAIFQALLAVYAWTLPATPPDRKAPQAAAPLAALRLLWAPAFAIYGICYFGVAVTMSLSSQGTPLLLRARGLSPSSLAATLTLGQVMEVLSLPLLAMFLLRLGLRGTMIVGLGAWTLALTLLAIGQPLGLVIGSLLLNGLLITCFLVTGQMFVNRSAGPGLRASAQGLLTFVNGLGMLLGHKLVGWLRDASGGDLLLVFEVGAIVMGALLALFIIAFRAPNRIE